jgi:hypothetical protein
MWEQLSAIVGIILGCASLIILAINYIRRDTKKEDELNNTIGLLKKFDLSEMHLMVTTMWKAYTADLPYKRPDLAQNHSPCNLTPAGLGMIPAEVKAELDKFEISPDAKENVVTGYLVVKIMGIERINALARENKVLVQEMIGILSAYLDCRLSEKIDSTH